MRAGLLALLLLFPILVLGQAYSYTDEAFLGIVRLASNPVTPSCTLSNGDKFNESWESGQGTWVATGTPDFAAAVPGTAPCLGFGSKAFESVGNSGVLNFATTNLGGPFNTPYYARLYFYISSSSLAAGDLTYFFKTTENVGSGNNYLIGIVNDTGQLKARCVGSTTAEANVSAGAWYRLEFKYTVNGTGTGIFRLYDASGTQIGTDASLDTPNNWFGFITCGIFYGTGANDLDIVIDGIGFSDTGWLGP